VRSIPNLVLRVDVGDQAAAAVAPARWPSLARYACFGLAALLLVLYLVFALAAPKPQAPR
jgi:hypothetical protein